MPFINFTNIVTVLLAVILFGLIIFLGKELHKSVLPAIMLFAFLIILICHAMELMLICSAPYMAGGRIEAIFLV